MTVVVTGATGHVGGNLVRGLLDRGRRVRALVLEGEDLRPLEGLDVEIVTGDVREVESLRRAFAGAEVVYHLAAYISIRLDEGPFLEAINIQGTRNVIDVCLERSVRRLIHFSSIEAFADAPHDCLIDENAPLAESEDYSPYARSKAAAEKEVRAGIARGLDTVIIYPTGVIGPHDYRPSHFGQVLLDFSSGRLPALVEGGFNWVDVRDVVKGAIRAEEKAPTGGRYILAGHWVSVAELATLLEEIVGVKPPQLTLPMWLARISTPVVMAVDRLAGRRSLLTPASLKPLRGYRHISHARAARDLGYQPRPFKETLIETLQWFEANGSLPRPLLPPYSQVHISASAPNA
jgi:dihydroflavonol-4-reductase